MLPASALAGEIPPAERRSGYDFMSRETRAMQDDDTANPGMLWVLEGEALWEPEGRRRRPRLRRLPRRRARQHEGRGRAPSGVRRRPGRPVNLEQRINLCRVDRQQAPALA